MEITDLLLTEWQLEVPRPAEQVLKAYTRSRRYIGGGDRRALQESVFALLRKFGSLKAQIEAAGLPLNGRSLALFFAGEGAAALCTGGYGPTALSEDERRASGIRHQASDKDSLPGWLHDRLLSQYGEETEALVTALMQPAPLDLRVNRLKATREQVQKALAAEGIETTPIDGLFDGLEAPRHAAISRSLAYRDGLVEIQDRGSQGVCDLLLHFLSEFLQSEDPKILPCPGLTRASKARGNGPSGQARGRQDGDRCEQGGAAFPVPRVPYPVIIDYCAGAGGKSLALASRLGEDYQIYAHDVDPERLKALGPRAERAGATTIRLCFKEKDLPDQADLVLLDVPCSGTGTIRRHPDLPWRLTPKKLANYQQSQMDILCRAAPRVTPGGLLAYVTCSLLESENSQCVNEFLTAFPHFRVVSPGQIWNKDAERIAPWLRLLPHRQGSDGFFAAVLKNN